jgi:hypothetical protein
VVAFRGNRAGIGVIVGWELPAIGLLSAGR